jgi:hypothetical protein
MRTACENQKVLLEKGGKVENGNIINIIIKGVNLFKIHCRHAWNYHKEFTLPY